MAGFATTAIDSDESFDDSEEVDPRIKIELESLNQAATDVNRLEKEINEARTKYQETFASCSQDLDVLRKKYGSKINKTRPYYEAREVAKVAQSEALLSARKYQSANGVYLAAKETISLAEIRLKDDKAASLTPAWQEMLNHALIRVMESEQEKTKSEKEHLERAAVFAEMEKKVNLLEKKHRNSITKARPYFDAKAELELKLQQIKQSIEDLHQAMQSAKSQYSQSLKNLEAISDGIHEARRKKLILMYPREPGVGAEEEAQKPLEELPALHTSGGADTDDFLSSDSEESDEDFDDDLNKHAKAMGGKVKTTDIQSNDDHHLEKPFRLVSVKDNKPVLRKSQSVPSYVVENQPEVSQDTFQIETDSVILKMESGTIPANSLDECAPNNVVTVKKVKTKTKSGPQILNPSALCYRDPAIGGSYY